MIVAKGPAQQALIRRSGARGWGGCMAEIVRASVWSS